VKALRSLYHAAPEAAGAEPTLRYSLIASEGGFIGRGTGRPPFGPASLEDAWSFLEWRATEDILAAEQRLVCLHAAGIRLGARNVLLIGASGSGKSTLAAHLMAAGHRAWGDDLVLFAPLEGVFSAFPRSLKLDSNLLSELSLVEQAVAANKEGTLLAHPVAYVSPAAIRSDWQAEPGRVDAVVLLGSDRHVGPATAERVSEGAAAILASQSVIAGHRPETEQATLMIQVLEAMRDAAAWRVSGAGAGAVARALEEALADA